jgi:hypothetical protein
MYATVCFNLFLTVYLLTAAKATIVVEMFFGHFIVELSKFTAQFISVTLLTQTNPIFTAVIESLIS